jgi:hypothetical protein
MAAGDKGESNAGLVREPEEPGSISLGRLLVAFLKIGSIGFGGGKAVIALMEQEFARERRLISVDEFVHGVALGQILGPFSANAAIFGSMGCSVACFAQSHSLFRRSCSGQHEVPLQITGSGLVIW